ncbi:C-type lectin BfL-2-like [Hemicordylus capensis]|uniref:C-type lectin BfL-2-like n=1 Tax=Hemicordylus capensis TaxID=884348 RepID=UPI0023049762|nr:C-type lectin BfL-2-like [Hemicordylus capensis]
MGQSVYLGLCLLGCLLFKPLVEGAEPTSCSQGWLQYQGRCYGYLSNLRNWAEAEIACQSYGWRGHLASIVNDEEAAEVASYIQTNHQNTANVWIGLHDPQNNREWKWTDGSISSYESWNAGEPHNLKNDCVELGAASGYLLWNDENCQSKRAFLCMYRL